MQVLKPLHLKPQGFPKLKMFSVMVVAFILAGTFLSVLQDGNQLKTETQTQYHSSSLISGGAEISHGKPVPGLPVNPFSIYKSEPAPMGIADYGIGANNTPYAYGSSSFMGVVHINSLETYNASLGPLENSMTFQLNVNLLIDNGKGTFVYWVQNVGLIDTATRSISFVDNIWNMSSVRGNIYNSTLSGNGSISNNSGQSFYFDWANSALLGNNISLSYPVNIYFASNISLNSQNLPEISFSYNDGFGWIQYDAPVFVFATNLTSYPFFMVNGYNYEPTGYTFYDSELVMGGPGNGTDTRSIDSNMNLQLEFWNGHNYQVVPDAFNFGSNTAEGVSNITSTGDHYAYNGSVESVISDGNGTLGQIYNSGDVGTINVHISPYLAKGIIFINNSRYQFVGSEASITLAPSPSNGYYVLKLYSNNVLIYQEKFTIAAGENLSLTANFQQKYTIGFTEHGLPQGASWSIILNGSQKTSNSSVISFIEPNGTYSYYVLPISGFLTFPPSGAVIVNGSNVYVVITFKPIITYKVTFSENGLPPSTSWYVNTSWLNSGPITASTYTVNLQNGTYSFSVSTGNNHYRPENSSVSVTVNGSNVLLSIGFTLVSYDVIAVQSGLPAGTIWWVNVTGGGEYSSSGSTIVFQEPNGTYKLNIGSSDKIFTPFTPVEKITVNGGNYSLMIGMTMVTYSASFSENGLPPNTFWFVNVTGVMADRITLYGRQFYYGKSGSEITIYLPNGTYKFSFSTGDPGYIPAVPYRNVTVNGSLSPLSIAFVIKTYSVVFSQSGLPGGTLWSVMLNGTTHSSANSSLMFRVPNGNYSVYIYNLSGYEVLVNSFYLVVNGSSVIEKITFYKTEPLIFSERGLPSGSNWSVTISGAKGNETIKETKNSINSSIMFVVPVGEYKYYVKFPSNFSSYDVNSSVNVLSSSSVTISTSKPFLGLSIYYLIAIIFAVILAVPGVLLFLASRKKLLSVNKRR